MKLYHKIETLFNRDMEGNKKLIEGDFRNKTVELLKDLNNWEFTEKIDGTNIRIIWDGHKVSLGGRTENAQIPTNLMNHLTDKFLGETNAQLFEQEFGERNTMFVGEGYGAKIQKGGGLYREDQGFILFDVCVEDFWYNREAVKRISQIFNVPNVPVVLSGTIQDGVDYVKNNPKCSISKQEKEAEGLVGRPRVELKDNRGERIIVKIKNCDF